MFIFKKIFFRVLFSVFLLAGCESLQQKIDTAEKSVNDAERVNASKYASLEIKSASNHLQKAKVHQASGLNADAEISVKNAKIDADKAYFKSLNEFIKSQNNLTDERMKTAKDSGADIHAPDKYNEAVKLSNQVKSDLKKIEELQKRLKDLEAIEKK